MAVSEQNFEMIAGDTKNLVVIVRNSKGELIDLSDVSAKWAIKTSRAKAESVVEKTLGNGLAIIDKGKIAIRIDAIDTQNISGNYYHGCEVVDGFDNVSTILSGMITIQQSGLSTPPISGLQDMDGGTFFISDDTQIFDGGAF